MTDITEAALDTGAALFSPARQALDQLPWLEGVAEATRERLSAQALLHRLPAGAMAFDQAEVPAFAIFLVSGALKLVGGLLRQVFSSSWSARLGYLLARPGLDRLREWLDPRRYNGAVMLGLNGVVVKSHGGTDASGFAHAVDVAMDMVVHRFNDRMREGLARIVSLQGGADARSGVGPKDGPGSGNGGPRLAATG